MAAARLEKRTVPESVTVPGKLALKVLAHLSATRELLLSLNGRVETPVDGVYEALVSEFGEAAFGPIPGDQEGSDEPWHTDPVTVEVTARGNRVAAAVLRDLLALGSPHGVLSALLTPEVREGVEDSVWELRWRAADVRGAGSIDVPRGGGA